MAAAQSSTAAPDASDASSDIYTQLEQYPWDADPEFQGGLAAILGPNPSREQAAELTLHARCFYFSRKFSAPVDFDGYKAWREQRGTAPIVAINGTSSTAAAPADPSSEPLASTVPPTAPAATSAEPEAPYPTSFAHIVELITTGQPIPGIKEIPNTVLEGQGTQSVKARRKKPWEKDTNEAAGAAASTEGP